MITSLNPDLLTVLTVVVVITLILAALSRDRAEQRKRRVSERLSRYCLNLETEETISARWGLLQRLMGTVRVLASPVVASLFAREKERVLVRQLLWSAGFRSENAISILAAAKSTFAIAVGLCTYVFVVRQGLIGLGPVLDAIAVMGGAVVGGIVPEYALRWVAGRRREAMRESLPDAIDLLVIAAQAGLSLDMAIDRVTREMGAFAPELGAEFSITLAEMQALPDRTEALQNLGERIGVREVQSFALTLIQTVRYGTPFAKSLKALGIDLRQARMIALEERGAKLPALLSLPLILFIMPAVFVVVIGPAIVSIMQGFGQ